MLNQNWSVRCWELGLSFLAIGGIIVNLENCTSAQIMSDDTLGSESYFFTANLFTNSIRSDQIGVKAIQNTNLFHNYSESKSEAITGKDVGLKCVGYFDPCPFGQHRPGGCEHEVPC